MTRRRATALAAATLLVLAACGSDSGTGPDTNGGGTKQLSANVDGTAFNPPSTTTGANYANGVLTIQGSSTTAVIQINVTNVDGTGTYQLGPSFVGDFAQYSTFGGTIATWTTVLSPGSGSVTITTLTDSRVAGTFQFTGQAAPSTAASGQKSVTSGQFDIAL